MEPPRMSSEGAEYFSPGRESGDKVDHDDAPEGRDGQPSCTSLGTSDEVPLFGSTLINL